MSRIVLVVPDTGPLISLGKADCLPILLKLDVPIIIVDQVLHEATRDRRFPDAGRIDAFVQGNPQRVTVFNTVVGEAAAAQRAAFGDGRQRGLGEAAVAEFLARLDEVAEPDSPVLLVYEDGDLRSARFILPANVHVVSTKALLLGMERRGLVPSAQAIWDRIRTAGRLASEAVVDDPGAGPTGPTRW